MSGMLFLKGFVVGVLIAAPIGPVGVLCIQRTLTKGRLYGLISGLGAATADAFYGCVVAFGLTMISNFLAAEQFWFRLIGGIFLCCLGLKDFLVKPMEATMPGNNVNYIGAYTSALFMTLMSPMTVLGCIALFAGLGIVNLDLQYISASMLVGGVFSGSGTWWVILSYTTGLFRRKIEDDKLSRIIKISGVVIAIFGVLAILSVLL